MPAKFGDHKRNSHSTVDDLYPLKEEDQLDMPRKKSTRQGLDRDQIRIYLRKDQKKALKLAALERNTTMQSLVHGLIVRFLDD